jgi:phosphocarrier protein HPr
MDGGALERRVTIANKRGLHARAAAKFVKCVSQYGADVTVTRDGNSVNGASIMGLMMLGAGIGSEIAIAAQGADAAEALDALAVLVESKFGEE